MPQPLRVLIDGLLVQGPVVDPGLDARGLELEQPLLGLHIGEERAALHHLHAGVRGVLQVLEIGQQLAAFVDRHHRAVGVGGAAHRAEGLAQARRGRLHAQHVLIAAASLGLGQRFRGVRVETHRALAVGQPDHGLELAQRLEGRLDHARRRAQALGHLGHGRARMLHEQRVGATVQGGRVEQIVQCRHRTHRRPPVRKASGRGER